MADDSLKDELDRTSIDQLHKVVLQISANCFELKKLCATVLTAVGTLIATFTHSALDSSLFVAGFVITLFFWLLDSQSYYYQEKLRGRMRDVAEEMSARRGPKLTVLGIGMPVPSSRLTAKLWRRVLHSALNPSMLFYLVTAALMVSLFTLYSSGVIQSRPIPRN